MPLVTIRLVKGEPIPADTKAELIRRVTEAVADTLHKNPAATWVILDEIDGENWGVGGAPLASPPPGPGR